MPRRGRRFAIRTLEVCFANEVAISIASTYGRSGIARHRTQHVVLRCFWTRCGSERHRDNLAIGSHSTSPTGNLGNPPPVVFGASSAACAVRVCRAFPRMQGNRVSRFPRSRVVLACHDSDSSADSGPGFGHNSESTRAAEYPLPELPYRGGMEGDPGGPRIRSQQNRLSPTRFAPKPQLHPVPHKAGVCEYWHKVR